MSENNTPAGSLNILVVDDEANIRKVLSVSLEVEGHTVTAVGSFQDAVAEAAQHSFDLAFVDLRLGTADGLDLIPLLLASAPWLKIVVITAYSSIETAVEAMRRGAADYIPKPFTPAQVSLALRKLAGICSLERKITSLQEELARSIPEADFSSASPIMQRAVDLAFQVAGSDANVLLLGEHGTGKSALAGSPFISGATGRENSSGLYHVPRSPQVYWKANSSGTSRARFWRHSLQSWTHSDM